jgi:predicted RND superfamily exporter protein
MRENEDASIAKWDMRLPFSVMVIALLAAVGSYYGQKEATSIALTEL